MQQSRAVASRQNNFKLMQRRGEVCAGMELTKDGEVM